VCVRMGAVGVRVVAGAGASDCARVGLLIQYAKHRRRIVCGLSGSTTFFYIIS
jgi:hypothetical protein